MENIIIVSHKFLTQPDDDFVIFLKNKKKQNIFHIRHSFSDAKDRCSYCTWYKKGVVFREFKSRDYKSFPEVFIYLKEFFFTIYWAVKSKIIYDQYIGMDGLCVLFGNFLRFFRIINKTIYWAIDFVPQKRFVNNFKNKLYRIINRIGYKSADDVWDISPRMMEAREKFLNLRISDYKHHRIVPYGVWTERIKEYNYNECNSNLLVFMGHLLEKQGVQLIINAMPMLLKKNGKIMFKIIGDGKYKNKLVEQAINIGVIKNCIFSGKIENIEELESEVATSCIAVAPYIKRLDTWTYYADPGKIKTYLACGVPVILTDISWNAKEIEENRCGIIIPEDTVSIVNSILALMEERYNQEYRNNAIEYSKRFNYNNIFNNLMYDQKIFD